MKKLLIALLVLGTSGFISCNNSKLEDNNDSIHGTTNESVKVADEPVPASEESIQSDSITASDPSGQNKRDLLKNDESVIDISVLTTHDNVLAPCLIIKALLGIKD